MKFFQKLSTLGNIRHFTARVVHRDYIAGVLQVLDHSCGVATFSTYLIPLEYKHFPLLPKDGHEKEIQFTLERGIGGVMHKQLVSYHTPVELEMVHFSIYSSIGIRTLPGLLNIFICIAFLEWEKAI